MFNKVLEIKTQDDETRGLLAECCTAMNAEYVRMKKIKRIERVSCKVKLLMGKIKGLAGKLDGGKVQKCDGRKLQTDGQTSESVENVRYDRLPSCNVADE